MNAQDKDELVHMLIQKKERLSKVSVAHIVFTDGRHADGDVLCTFDSEDTNFQYFLFRDGTKTSDGLWVVYIARYDVINSVIQNKGFEVGRALSAPEIGMVEDLIKARFSRGLIKKKPILKLALDGVASVSFS